MFLELCFGDSADVSIRESVYVSIGDSVYVSVLGVVRSAIK
jgi:hypothetical protein